MCLYRRMLCTQEVSKRCINNYLFSFYQHSVHASSVLLLHLCVLL